MLNDIHAAAWSAYYGATAKGGELDEKTMALIGLAAGMALNCHPCVQHYREACRQHGCSDAAIADVLAKVMAVAAGQKKIQFSRYQGNDSGSACC